MGKPRRINRVGWFFEGQAMNWDIEDNGSHPPVMQVTDDDRVLVGGVEIVPWSHTLKKSKKKKVWLVPGVQIV